jgi:hypothetical protein
MNQLNALSNRVEYYAAGEKSAKESRPKAALYS